MMGNKKNKVKRLSEERDYFLMRQGLGDPECLYLKCVAGAIFFIYIYSLYKAGWGGIERRDEEVVLPSSF